MEPSRFDEIAFFRAIHASGARALLIGRRALVLLGMPLLTADYDFWLAIDDIAAFNGATAAFDLHPSVAPDEARRRGRYVLENDEHVDVLVAPSVTTAQGDALEFERLWSERQSVRVDDATVWLPSIDGLILTKRIAARPRDLDDNRLLRLLKEQQA